MKTIKLKNILIILAIVSFCLLFMSMMIMGLLDLCFNIKTNPQYIKILLTYEFFFFVVIVILNVIYLIIEALIEALRVIRENKEDIIEIKNGFTNISKEIKSDFNNIGMKKETSLKVKLLRILFIMWFFGSVLAMLVLYYLKQKNNMPELDLYIILIFGQVFFIMGVILLFKKSDIPIAVISLFIYVGAAVITLALLYNYLSDAIFGLLLGIFAAILFIGSGLFIVSKDDSGNSTYNMISIFIRYSCILGGLLALYFSIMNFIKTI